MFIAAVFSLQPEMSPEEVSSLTLQRTQSQWHSELASSFPPCRALCSTEDRDLSISHVFFEGFLEFFMLTKCWSSQVVLIGQSCREEAPIISAEDHRMLRFVEFICVQVMHQTEGQTSSSGVTLSLSYFCCDFQTLNCNPALCCHKIETMSVFGHALPRKKAATLHRDPRRRLDLWPFLEIIRSRPDGKKVQHPPLLSKRPTLCTN